MQNTAAKVLKKNGLCKEKAKKNVALLLLEKTPVRQDLRGKDPLESNYLIATTLWVDLGVEY